MHVRNCRVSQATFCLSITTHTHLKFITECILHSITHYIHSLITYSHVHSLTLTHEHRHISHTQPSARSGTVPPLVGSLPCPVCSIWGSSGSRWSWGPPACPWRSCRSGWPCSSVWSFSLASHTETHRAMWRCGSHKVPSSTINQRQLKFRPSASQQLAC